MGLDASARSIDEQAGRDFGSKLLDALHRVNVERGYERFVGDAALGCPLDNPFSHGVVRIEIRLERIFLDLDVEKHSHRTGHYLVEARDVGKLPTHRGEPMIDERPETSDSRVVMDNHFAVSSEAHVELDAIRSTFGCKHECL